MIIYCFYVAKLGIKCNNGKQLAPFYPKTMAFYVSFVTESCRISHMFVQFDHSTDLCVIKP